MDSPGSRPGGRTRVAPPADGLVLYRRARSSWRSVQPSESNELPASKPETSRMSGKGANPKEQILCPKCGSRVQRRNMRKHERSVHQGVRCRRHVCPYYSAEKCRTYSTFQDWKNHLQDTHEQCLVDDDPLQREEYAAGFKIDRWERFHNIEGDENDRAYLRIATLGKHYGQYQGQEEGEPPGPPSTIRLPHTKGTTPDKDVTPTESERAGSDHGGSNHALTPSGIRPCRRSLGTRNGINGMVCRSFRWKRAGAYPIVRGTRIWRPGRDVSIRIITFF